MILLLTGVENRSGFGVWSLGLLEEDSMNCNFPAALQGRV